MLTVCIVIFFRLSSLHAQAGTLFYDQTTQGLSSWHGGQVVASTTSNIGQFVVNGSNGTLELMDNSGSIMVQTSSFTSTDPDGDGDNDLIYDASVALASNHQSQMAIIDAPESGGSTTVNITFVTNSRSNGMINMAGVVLASTLPSPQLTWTTPPYGGGSTALSDVSAAMDNQYLYMTFSYWRSDLGTHVNQYWYAIATVGDSPAWVVSPQPIPRPTDGLPAWGLCQPTVTCNRWAYTSGNAVIGYAYADPVTGRQRPAMMIADPNGPPPTSSNLIEPPLTPITPCLWVRAVNFDNPNGTGPTHYFYAYQPQPRGGTYSNNTLWSTDGATVSSVISTNLVLITYPGFDGTIKASPGVADGYISAIPSQAATVYCAFVENSSTPGMQNLRITREWGNNNSIVQTNPTFNWYSLGCNQMGVFIPFDNNGSNSMWRAFRPFYGDIMENTLATGLCKVNPNANTAILGIGVGTSANLNDTLRVFAESEITPAQTFQFWQTSPPGPPVALWAGEHPSASVDADPGNARGDIILDLGSDVDFGGAESLPLVGVTLQARSDGQIDYNGANFNNENGDLIGCTGETRVADESINSRGIWNMNAPLSDIDFWLCSPATSNPITNGIRNGSSFGGVKGEVNFIQIDDCMPFLTICDQGSNMNFDSTWMFLGFTGTNAAADQIVAEDLGDGGGPPSSVTFTNGIISNLNMQHNGWIQGTQDFEIRPNNPGSAAAFQLNGLENINISNDYILFTQFDITNPITSVNFNFDSTEDIQNLIDLVWTNYSQFAGQININNNQFAGDWPFGSGSISDASQTIIFDGFTVPVSDQWMVHCDGNIFYNHSSGDAGTTFYNPNSTAVQIIDGADVDVSDNFIGGYGIGIDNQIQGNAYAFYCNNFIFQSDACPPRGIGILEQVDPGSVYPKLNTTADLAVGYWAEGRNASTPVANQFGSNNSAFVLSGQNETDGRTVLLVTIGSLQPGTEPGTIGAIFQDKSATLLFGSHTGSNNFAGFNQFWGNTEAQVKILDDVEGDQFAQPTFGFCSTSGSFGENVFTAPSGAVQFEAPNVVFPPYQMNFSLTENQWSPTSINNDPHGCTHFNIDNTWMPNVSYQDKSDGTATGSFVCGTDDNGHNYKTKKGNINGGTLSIEDTTNPVDPSDTAWLYFEALRWIGVNPQFALDTMKLFIERFPSYKPLIPSALNYTLQIVTEIADTGQYIQKQPWIDLYNWLVSIYTNDTATWYVVSVFGTMESAAYMFNHNLAANIDWNMERLFPGTFSTDSSAIFGIRRYQKEIPEDTTAFYLMQIPPVPIAPDLVTTEPAQGITLSVVPDPADQSITAYISSTFSTPATLEIYDELGHRVQALPSPRLQMGTNQFNFDCASLAAGNYFLRLEASGTVQTVNITIEH